MQFYSFRKRWGARMSGKSGWQWILPSLIGVLIFFVLPFGVVIYYSCIDNVIQKNFVGLDNIFELCKNEAFLLAVKNTLIFSLTAIPLSIIFAVLLALVLERAIPGKSMIRSFFLTPMMVPAASVVVVWQALFHDNGYINSFLTEHGGETIRWLNSGYGMVVVVLIFIWKTMGYNMVLFMAGLAGIPADYSEIARQEGAGRWWQFWHIKFRYLFPTFFFVLLYDIICSFKVFREIYLLTGDYPCEALYMLQHFMNNTFQSANYQKLSSAAMLMAAVLLVLVAVLFAIERKFGKDLED